MANVPGLAVTEARNVRSATKIEGGLRDDLEEVDLKAFEDYERGDEPAGEGEENA